MTTTMLSPEVERYLARVRDALSDLPIEERDDLLADVEASVVAAVEEGGAVAARLGQPEDFAAELRAAAGLQQLETTAGRGGLRERVRSSVAHPRIVALREALTSVAPVWWVARAYVVVAATALWWEVPWSTTRLPVPLLESGLFGVVTIAVVATASVWLGFFVRRTSHRTRHVAALANLLIAILALPVLAHLLNQHPAAAAGHFEQAPPPDGLAYYGAPIDNVYPYSRDGELLQDVLLYDSAGRPLEVRRGDTDPSRRVLQTGTGEPIFNSFPIRYFEPGTAEVEEPDATPPVVVPEVVTPPLERRRP